MKPLTKEKINEICNSITEKGSKPYALVSVSAEMAKQPKSGAEIFYSDTMPQVVAVVDSAEAVLKLLAEQGVLTSNLVRTYGNRYYDCQGYIACRLFDEFEEGNNWEINTDDILADTPCDYEEDIKALRVKSKNERE